MIQENILLKLSSVLVKNHSLYIPNWNIKTKQVRTGGLEEENTMYTHFYKPKVYVVCLILGCIWTIFLANKNRHISRKICEAKRF